ncbi:MAG TPA: cell division protein ZipA C-terminal FtsZ-binding domain-containing protein [Steroidobacteraceae bacterium]|nr:cell division protein ZipA C-terminal FtsZ-binding domain-containing protein [Steroidobacteraceae bacterium]
MMWQLRWTLLGLGLIFIVALAWWERRRPRQARGSTEHPPPREPVNEVPPRLVREPPLTLPEIRARDPLSARGLPVVEPLRAVPVLDSAPTAAAEEAEEEVAAEETAAADAEAGVSARTAAEEEALGERQELAAAWEAVPALETNPAREVATAGETGLGDASEAGRQQEPDGDAARTPDDAQGAAASTAPAASARRTAPTARALPRERLPELPAAEPPLVSWPSDEERRILAVRLVAPMSERFAGRSLRQALAAEGFMLGEFAIFHKPDDERRAVLSAASLNRPGTFDMETMDSQHYGGLSLFAVLPGPKSPPQTFDELVFTARNLNERLHGVLQDEHGTPLTPARIAQLREQLRAAS